MTNLATFLLDASTPIIPSSGTQAATTAAPAVAEQAAQQTQAASGLFGNNPVTVIIVYCVIIFAVMYFFSIRPTRKREKKMQEMMASIAVGDSVLTSSGFYGVIIDMTDDTVIVEFGNNKNCRIPMQKQAIVQVEKPEQ